MDFFHLTATSGFTRGGVHPTIWELFFLGGHCQELLFKVPIRFLPRFYGGELDFFHLTATLGLTRGGVHPKIWALFFLGGHYHELFFKPHIGLLALV